MNKKELISAVAEKNETTKKAATVIVDSVIEAITEAIVAGDEVRITGFGTFAAVEVPERTGVIQLGERKGETYVSPAHKAPRFKASTVLKAAVR